LRVFCIEVRPRGDAGPGRSSPSRHPGTADARGGSVVTRRRVSNPLALAVLALTLAKPMPPYEMSLTLRERSKEGSVRLNYGSLYSVVDKLVRHHLIEPVETVREGRRPERTVYRATPA